MAVKPNITGLSLENYLKMRQDQLLARKNSIEVYNENYLPEWGDKRYTDEDMANIEMEIKEVDFAIVALRQFVSGELKLGKKDFLDRQYSVIENN